MSTKFLFSIPLVAIFWLTLFASLCPSASATVRLPAVISDNMVLQQSDKVPIWGWANPGESVSVVFAGQKLQTVADKEGNWRVELRNLKASISPCEMTVKGSNTITIHNILIGEVWLCAGQSNMAMALMQTNHGLEVSTKANVPTIRFFRVAHQTNSRPISDVAGKWEVCSPSSAQQFSAVGYFFGRSLNDNLSLPIGLIEASWGGTPAELWISKESLAKQTNLQGILGRWAKEVNYYQARIPVWYQQQCLKRHLTVPNVVPSNIVADSMNRLANLREPSCLFNGMISPLAPFAIAGVIWYQGESNVDRAAEYKYLLPLLIVDWRAHWAKEFPFLYVQLPNFANAGPANTWAEVREAQLQTLSVPNTAMVVSIDLGDPQDLHPRNKVGIGNRLALAALGKVYNRNIEYSGPLFGSLFIRKNVAVVTFTHTAGQLKYANGKEVKGFAVAGPNRIFAPAKALIFQDKVWAVSPSVPNPVAVRYGWDNNPSCNLVNAVNLPASPFRTDNWNN